MVRFPVIAALRYLFALARRFRFEGFGIRAAIHANPDLLSNVRALVIVCAVHAGNCTLRPTPTRRAILFLAAISFGQDKMVAAMGLTEDTVHLVR